MFKLLRDVWIILTKGPQPQRQEVMYKRSEEAWSLSGADPLIKDTSLAPDANQHKIYIYPDNFV